MRNGRDTSPAAATRYSPGAWSSEKSATRTVSPDAGHVCRRPSVPLNTTAPLAASCTSNGPGAAPTTTARLGAPG